VNSIDWRHIDEGVFNKLVDALLVRDYAGSGLIATAIDGRGGDGGIDIDVTVKKTGQLVKILQVKYFPEGFSGGHRNRRRQIKDSFDKAMAEHHPPVWALVTPRKVTAQERKAVLEMRRGRIVRMEFIGPVELDLLLSKYPEIRDHYLQDYGIRLLSAINRPEAALAKSGDLASETRRIQKQLDGRSQYWGFAFGIEPDGTYTETLYAKRPDAPIHEPLSVNFTAVFSPKHEDLRTRFQAGMDYGLARPLVLPSDVVTSFKKAGASWFEEEAGGAEVHLIPMPQAIGKPVQVVALDRNGARLASLNGTTKSIVNGAKGATVDVAFDGGFNQLWRFPKDLSLHGEVTFEYGPTGHRARDVRGAIRFVNALTRAERLTIAIDGAEPIPMQLSGEASREIPTALSELIEDLAFIENELDVSLVIPEEGVTNDERLWARIIARVLQGRAVPYPGIDGFNFQLTGAIGDSIEGFLSEPHAIGMTHSDWSMTLLGAEVYVGEVVTYQPRAFVVDGTQHLEALRAGRGKDRNVQVKAIDDLPFSFYSPTRLEKGRPVVTEQWGIEDAPEVPNLDKLQELQRAGISLVLPQDEDEQ